MSKLDKGRSFKGKSMATWYKVLCFDNKMPRSQ